MRTACQDIENALGDVGLVVPFFHSPMALTTELRPIFERGLRAAPHAERLRRASLTTRVNLARIFVAARLASRHRAPLVLVEGWRAQGIHGGAGTHHVTGSRMALLLLKMLQRRGLADPTLSVLRRDASRCTEEEVAAVREAAASLTAPRIVGVAGRACPSRRRAARYLRLQGAERACVLDCWRLLEAWRPTMTADERVFTSALARSAAERLQGGLVEAASWLVHWASRAERLLRREAAPLEVRIAHRLRLDRA